MCCEESEVRLWTQAGKQWDSKWGLWRAGSGKSPCVSWADLVMATWIDGRQLRQVEEPGKVPELQSHQSAALAWRSSGTDKGR